MSADLIVGVTILGMMVQTPKSRTRFFVFVGGGCPSDVVRNSGGGVGVQAVVRLARRIGCMGCSLSSQNADKSSTTAGRSSEKHRQHIEGMRSSSLALEVPASSLNSSAGGIEQLTPAKNDDPDCGKVSDGALLIMQRTDTIRRPCAQSCT